MQSVRARKIAVKTAVVLFFLFFAVAGNVGLQGYREYRGAEAARAEGKIVPAIVHYHRAIRWYLPGAFYVTRSAQGLWELGSEAEKRGERETALMAYQELRSGFYASRSFYTPGKAWIEKCNQKIASLMAEWEMASRGNGGGPPGESLETLRERHFALLSGKDRPGFFWSALLVIGFVGWVGASVAFILLVFRGDKGFDGKRALGWGGLFLCFYFLWILGMLKA